MFCAHRSPSVALVSLTLTAPLGASVRPCAAPFAAAIGSGLAGGALLVLDVAPNGREHLHGLALVDNVPSALREWCRITGASERGNWLKSITGWNEPPSGKPDRLLGNVAHVLAYAFKPWPVEHGQRQVSSDVCASGAFAPAWESVLRALAAGVTLPSFAPARACEGCRAVMRADKRRHARWCSKRCKTAGHRARERERADG